MKIRSINGMGDPKPVKCAWCVRDNAGRAMHYVNLHGEGHAWLCTPCFNEWNSE